MNITKQNHDNSVVVEIKPQRIDISFCLNPNRLNYFSRYCDDGIEMEKIFEDAKKTQKKIDSLRKQNGLVISSLFKQLFSEILIKKITVELFPDYFNIGAVNITDQLILIGQKSRSVNFYLALLIHEIAHIYSAKIFDNKLINEIISMLLEAHIYKDLDNKKIEDIRTLLELDHFHSIAITYSILLYDKFRQNIKDNKSIVDFMPILYKEIDSCDLQIIPPCGLLANLSTK